MSTRLALCDVRGPLNDLLEKLSGEEGEMWLRGLNKFLRKEEAWRIFPQYPADGVEFVLTFNFDSREANPLEMMYRDLRRWNLDVGRWKNFIGKKVAGVQIRAFKLVRAGCCCSNLDEVRQKLAQYGEIPEGQWCQAFKDAYPHSDGNGPVGIADPSWVLPNGVIVFPGVDSGGTSGFYLADDVRGENWRWLVPAGKPS